MPRFSMVLSRGDYFRRGGDVGRSVGVRSGADSRGGYTANWGSIYRMGPFLYRLGQPHRLLELRPDCSGRNNDREHVDFLPGPIDTTFFGFATFMATLALAGGDTGQYFPRDMDD